MYTIKHFNYKQITVVLLIPIRIKLVIMIIGVIPLINNHKNKKKNTNFYDITIIICNQCQPFLNI